MAAEFHGISSLVGGGLPLSNVTPNSTALMIIDMQYLDAHRAFGLGARAIELGLKDRVDYYFTRLEKTVVPTIRRLQESCRATAIPIIHVRIMNLARNSADTSWRYRQMGICIPPGEHDGDIIEELAPVSDEIVLSKTTSNTFASTNADFLLRNMGIDTLIMTGVVTNNCVESTTRAAADIGYRVLLVEDGCAAWTPEGHDYSLRHLHRNFAIVKSGQTILGEIDAASRHVAVRG